MIEVLKQALEALYPISHNNTDDYRGQADKAITSLRQAIKELESQEPVAWTSDDMAYRPSGLPQDFVKHEVESVYDWSDWVCPNPEQYFMKCCDCGLVHEMQFKVAKYKLGNECEFVEDTNLQAVFKARRTHQPERTEQEPVAWRTFDGEGGYDYRSYEDNESYADDWNKRNPNHKGWVDKLYTTPPPCPTCEALARTVMMDQTGRDA